jgi:hypothetical protein
MVRRSFRAPVLCVFLLLGACAPSHWTQGESPGNAVTPPPNVPIKHRLTIGDLRAALTRCVAKYDRDQLPALDGTSDDGLRAMLAGKEPLEFNQCMSGQGWLSMPDYLLAP